MVRYWKDVAGEEKRQRVYAKICPISGPGKLSASERERKAKENCALWDAVPNLSAVKEGHVYCLTSTAFVVPGPRAVEAAEILFTLLQKKNPE